MINKTSGRSVALGALSLGLLALFLLKPASNKSVVSRSSQAWAQNMDYAPTDINWRLPAQVATLAWPEPSKEMAAIMIARYGKPDDYDDDSLIWYDNGPWKRTIVHREGYQDQTMTRPDAVLEQSVNYRVPLGKFKELQLFDPRLVPNRPRNELSMRSESEQMNFLAINLADEIIVGWKDVGEAKRVYAQISELAKSGKSSPYMEGLRFQVEK